MSPASPETTGYGYLIPEGDLEEVGLKKLLRALGANSTAFKVLHSYKGKRDKILADFPKITQIARRAATFVLLDLEMGPPCAPALLSSHNIHPLPSARLCFRVAVRTVECWLMADREAFARFMGLSQNRIPRDPENLSSHPKDFVVNLARRSRKKSIKERMVPSEGERTGKEYTPVLIEFVEDFWDPNRARKNAPSLDKAIRCFERALHSLTSRQ